MDPRTIQTVFQILILSAAIVISITNYRNKYLFIIGIVLAVSVFGSYWFGIKSSERQKQEIFNQEKKENEDIRQRCYCNVLSELSPLLNKQINLFVQIFKSTIETPPNQVVQNIPEFFNDNFYRTIKRLDHLKKAPIIYVKEKKDLHVTWAEYIEYEVIKFRKKLDDCKNILVNANLKDDIVLKLIDPILTYCKEYEKTAAINPGKPDLLIVHFMTNTLWGENTWLDKYIESVINLTEIHNQFSEQKIKINYQQLWEKDQSPKIGSAIKEKEYYRVESINGDKVLKKIE